MARPEPADFVFLEDIVAGKYFVGALTGENDLEIALANQFGEHEKGRGGGSDDRRFRMPDDFRENGPDVFFRAAHILMVGFKGSNRNGLESRFIEALVGETDRKGAEPIVEILFDQGTDIGAVNSPTQVSADRHIRPQTDPRRIQEQSPQFIHPIGQGALPVILMAEIRRPVWLDVHALAIDPGIMAGQQAERCL